MPCGSSKGNSNHDESNHCAFEDLDHSVLQQPLNLGVTNVKQILRCIQSGSKEVKDIILNECNIIYECKVCDGLFRSLANFLYHKRCYCKKHLCEDMLLFENLDEEIITVNPEPPLESKDKADNFPEIPRLADCTVDLVKSNLPKSMELEFMEKSSNPDSSKVENDSPSQAGETETEDKIESSMISRRTKNKNAQTAIKVISTEEPPVKCTNLISARIIRKDSNQKNIGENLSDKDGKTKRITITKFPDSKKTKESPFPKVIFEAIDSNPHAVYQHSDNKELGTSSSPNTAAKTKNGKEKVLIVMKKDEVMKNPVAKSTEKIKELQKIKEFHLTRRKRLLARNDCDLNELKCLVCKTQFMSLRTLYFHMLSLHSKKRLYYPCPFCDALFVQIYGVSRHLASIHNKTKEQISKLRDIIKKKSIWKKIEDVQTNESMTSSVKSEIQQEIKEEEAEAVESCTKSKPANIATNSKFVEIVAKSQLAENPTNSKPVENVTKSQLAENPTNSKPVESVTKTKPTDENVSVKKNLPSDLLSKKPNKEVILHSCGKCGRVFGRKSSQVSHEKFCIMNTVIKKENVDDPPATPQALLNTPVLSFMATPPQKQAPPTPSKPATTTLFKQATPVSNQAIPTSSNQAILTSPNQANHTFSNQANPTSTNQATHTSQKQSTQTPRKQAVPKATCVLHISKPGVASAPKPFKSENNPVNKPAVEMPANLFNVKLSTRPKRGAEKQMHKDFVNSQTLKWRSANRVDTSTSSKAHVPVKKVSGKSLEKKVLGFINSEDLTCLKCKKKFSSYSNLRRHVAIHVGWTRFKCRYCDYQAYNKSQCWSHVQKSHSVEDEEVEKYIVHLANCGPKKKTMQKSNGSGKQNVNVSPSSDPCSQKMSKRKAVYNHKYLSTKKQSQMKNELDLNQELDESDLRDCGIKVKNVQVSATASKVVKKSWPGMKMDKTPATITVTKMAHRDSLNAKKRSQATITIQKIPMKETEGGKKDKTQYVIPLNKVPLPDSKKESSYKTVTTSKPTTIILSKTIPSKALQSIVTVSPEKVVAAKTSPTRTSPRKPETVSPEEKLTTSVTERSLENTKVTPLHLKIQGKSDSTDEASCPKKQKLVNEWFPKKDLPSTVCRRDSAPLIIGLVPATKSNSQAKSSTGEPEGEN